MGCTRPRNHRPHPDPRQAPISVGPPQILTKIAVGSCKEKYANQTAAVIGWGRARPKQSLAQRIHCAKSHPQGHPPRATPSCCTPRQWPRTHRWSTSFSGSNPRGPRTHVQRLLSTPPSRWLRGWVPPSCSPMGWGSDPEKPAADPSLPRPRSQAPLVRAPRAPICQTLHALQVFRALVRAPRDTSAPSPISHRLVCSFLRGLPGLARS